MNKNLTLGLVFIFSLVLSITHTKQLTHAGEDGKVIDPICNMQIDKGSAKILENDGDTYYFCSDHCKATFTNNPEKYTCICPRLHEGCDCGHCEGNGGSCICAEASVDSHKKEHKHEHGDGEHHH